MSVTFTRGLTVAVICVCVMGIAYAQQAAQKSKTSAEVKLKWLPVETTTDGKLHAILVRRAKIPGGWLVTTTFTGHFGGNGVTFVPDATHAWDGGSLE